MTMTFLYTIKDRDECEVMDEIYLPLCVFYLCRGGDAASRV
jgi:hypothetical protein